MIFHNVQVFYHSFQLPFFLLMAQSLILLFMYDINYNFKYVLPNNELSSHCVFHQGCD